MRIIFSDTSHPLRLAKSLRRELQSHGYDFHLRRCQEIVARIYGYSNWHELSCSVTGSLSSPWDHLVSPEDRTRRYNQYVQALIRAGIAQDVSHAVIEKIQPTARRRVEIDGNYEFLLQGKQAQDLTVSKWTLADAREYALFKGGARLLEAIYQAAVADPFWPQRGSLKVCHRSNTWLVKLLADMRQDIHHPAWPPVMTLVLGQVASERDSDWNHATKIIRSARAALRRRHTPPSFLEAVTEEELYSIVQLAMNVTAHLVARAGKDAGVPGAPMLIRDEFYGFYIDPWKPLSPFTFDPPVREAWCQWNIDDLLDDEIDGLPLPDKVMARGVLSDRDPVWQAFFKDTLGAHALLSSRDELMSHRFGISPTRMSLALLVGLSYRFPDVGLMIDYIADVQGQSVSVNFKEPIYREYKDWALAAPFCLAILRNHFLEVLADYSWLVAPYKRLTVRVSGPPTCSPPTEDALLAGFCEGVEYEVYSRRRMQNDWGFVLDLVCVDRSGREYPFRGQYAEDASAPID